MPPNSFIARLIDHSGALTGETLELCDDPEEPQGEIVAIFTGQHREGEVTLEKRYDDLRRADYVVHYVGRVGDEGHEISGSWSIPGVWSGSFVMIRERDMSQPVEARVSESVR
jgi:hypothetical protein